MLLQDVFTQRIITILVFQTWPVVFQLILSFKLIKRARNTLTFTLFTYFILNSLSYIFSFLSAIFVNTSVAYPLYLITWFLIIFSQGFIVIFTWELTNIIKPAKFKKIFPMIISYAIISLCLIIQAQYFRGIRYDEQTGWIPLFHWSFTIVNWIVFIIFLVTPQSLMINKLFQTFEGEIIKKRIFRYLCSVYLEFLIILLLTLYHTFVDNQIFRTIYFIITFPSALIAAYFIYKSFGKELE